MWPCGIPAPRQSVPERIYPVEGCGVEPGKKGGVR